MKKTRTLRNRKRPKRWLTGLILILFGPHCGALKAQQMRSFSESIRSMQIMKNGEKSNVPILELGSGERLSFSFDDLTKEYRRYVCKVEHCDYEWKKSTRIFESDYLRGTETEYPIENYHESLNTTVDYTHYQFDFPNSRMNVVYSGNYRIRIVDDEENREVCHFCFSVVEPNGPMVNVTATTNTDIDWNKEHQQLKVNLATRQLGIHDPAREIKLVAIQNGRWDMAVMNPRADNVTPSEIRWDRVGQLIFPAGNEFRKFEITNLKNGLMGVDNLRWVRPYYHATLFAGKMRPNYLYDEDKDGLYFISDTERADDDYEADYVLVHFFLEHEPETKGVFYVNGALTNWEYAGGSMMKYNPDAKGYEATLLLKEGYYNYQYLFLPQGANVAQNMPVEGNFYQTENEYTLLIYYTQRGSRYDRLVGVRNFLFQPSKQ